jgi:MFS family permease
MPDISREFGFTPTQKGYIFSSFSLAYALFEIPSGWLGDRFGARLALTRIVVLVVGNDQYDWSGGWIPFTDANPVSLWRG